MRRNRWLEARRVLAVRLDNIGDVVMLGPALRSLRMNLPDAQIDLLASVAGVRAAPLLPWIDRALAHRAVWQDASFTMPLEPESQQSLFGDLAERGYDAAIVFTSFSQSPYPPAYACYMAGIPLRAGQSNEFGGSVLTDWVRPAAESGHQVDRNLHLLESLGFETTDGRLELRPAAGHVDAARTLLAGEDIDPDGPYIVAAPGASCPARRYDPARFAEAVGMLAGESGMPVVMVGTARDESAVGPAIRRNPRIRSLAGRDTVPSLAALIAGSALLVGVNSAPMHIADAFGTPMVILYSGTEMLSQWRPRRSPARLLRREVSCSPCYLFQCPYRMECLDVEAVEVAAAGVELLQAAAAARAGEECAQ